MGLTAMLALVADVSHTSRIGAAGMAGIGLVTLLKARMILADYLGLRAVPGALTGFVSAVALTLVIVVAAFVLVPIG
jgi:hypothetical protein